MGHPIRPLAYRTAAAAVLVTIALARAPTALVAIQRLDPGIRTAIAARTPVSTPVAATTPRLSPSDEGFAWTAAALGLGAGIAAMCAVLVCVSLVRHDGPLRHA